MMIVVDQNSGHRSCNQRQKMRIFYTLVYSHHTADKNSVKCPSQDSEKVELAYFDTSKLAVTTSTSRLAVGLDFALRVFL